MWRLLSRQDSRLPTERRASYINDDSKGQFRRSYGSSLFRSAGRLPGPSAKGVKAWEKFLAQHEDQSLDEITAKLDGLMKKDAGK